MRHAPAHAGAAERRPAGAGRSAEPPHTSAAGFDIRSEIGTDGRSAPGADVADALLTQETGRSGVARLVTMDLATGQATALGALGRYRSPIGMAVALDA